MIDTMTSWIIWYAFGGIISILLGKRFVMLFTPDKENEIDQDFWVISQTTGNKEVMADCAHVYENEAGIMAVVADGIGKENTGKISAQIAVDTILDYFSPYHELNQPDYLFQTAFLEANSRIQKTIGERRGGASVGAVYSNGKHLYYALAGNIRIALMRNGELIPLSKGQTMDVLVKDAYHEGLISKQETIRSIEDSRVWNYLGLDGFGGIETCSPPILLQQEDIILLSSQGIYDELSWSEMEETLLENMTLKEMADSMVMKAEQKSSQEKENGSILLFRIGGYR